MRRGGGDSENVAGTGSADNSASEGAINGQVTTEQGPTTQTGDNPQQGTEMPGTESQEPAGSSIAEVKGIGYPTLQAAIDKAPETATVKLLANANENVTISTPRVTLDLNGHTLNGGTEEGKPALTVTARNVTVTDSSKTQAGTIKREDTADNSGVSSHYVIDVQGSGLLFFDGGNVINNSGTADGKGAPLVRVGGGSKSGKTGGADHSRWYLHAGQLHRDQGRPRCFQPEQRYAEFR